MCQEWRHRTVDRKTQGRKPNGSTQTKGVVVNIPAQPIMTNQTVSMSQMCVRFVAPCKSHTFENLVFWHFSNIPSTQPQFSQANIAQSKYPYNASRQYLASSVSSSLALMLYSSAIQLGCSMRRRITPCTLTCPKGQSAWAVVPPWLVEKIRSMHKNN